MSYSLSTSGAILSDQPALIDEKIAALPDGPGKDEALEHRDTILSVVAMLGEHVQTSHVTASVSGSASPSGGSFSVNIWQYVPPVDPNSV